MRRVSGWTALLVSVLACADSIGPDGSLLVSARFDGTSWGVTDPSDISAFLEPSGRLLISAISRDRPDLPRASVLLEIEEFRGAGTYVLGSGSTEPYAMLTIYYTDIPYAASFLSSPPDAGTIRVTEVDTAQRRVAGVFSFDGLHESSNTRLKVTQGFFRVEY